MKLISSQCHVHHVTCSGDPAGGCNRSVRCLARIHREEQWLADIPRPLSAEK